MTSIRSSSHSPTPSTILAQSPSPAEPSNTVTADPHQAATNAPNASAEAAEAGDSDTASATGTDAEAAGQRTRTPSKDKKRDSAKAQSSDAGDGDASTSKSVTEGGKRGTKSKKAKDSRNDKKAMAKTTAGSVRRGESKDRNEAVEQVSVLVGQDDSGDALEQGAHTKNLFVADDEHQNAFTSAPDDNFDPGLEPVQVERLGSIQGAVHMVKLTDYWQSSGWDRQAIVEAAARKLLGFARSDQAKKLLKEMSAAPIKCVYPLEVMLQILDANPEFLPKVARGAVVENRDELASGKGIQAGHEFLLRYPAKAHITDFAILGGGDVGYEFAPYKNGVHYMIIDTPGDWTCVLAAQELGKTTIDTVTVHVHESSSIVDEEFLSF